MISETLATHSGDTRSTLRMPLQAMPIDRSMSTAALADGGIEADIDWGKVAQGALQALPTVLSWF